jgi:hypothetical protein
MHTHTQSKIIPTIIMIFLCLENGVLKKKRIVVFFSRLVAPDVLHHHVKSIPDSSAKNLHFQAPEMTDGWFGMIIVFFFWQLILSFRLESHHDGCGYLFSWDGYS